MVRQAVGVFRVFGIQPSVLRFPDDDVECGFTVVPQDHAAVGDADQVRQYLTERGCAGDHVIGEVMMALGNRVDRGPTDGPGCSSVSRHPFP
jgi:hypothetical protein